MRLLVEALSRVDIGMGGTGDARFCNAIGLSPLGMTDVFMDYIRCVQKVETQDFASLLGVYAVIVSGLLNGCICMGCS